MVVNDNARNLTPRSVYGLIASELAFTGGLRSPRLIHDTV